MAYARLPASAQLPWQATPPAHFVFSPLPVTARPASGPDGSDHLLPERPAQMRMQAQGVPGASGAAGAEAAGAGAEDFASGLDSAGGAGGGGSAGFAELARLNTGGPSTASGAGFDCASFFFAAAAVAAASALADCQVPSAIQLLFASNAPETVNSPCEIPVRTAS